MPSQVFHDKTSRSLFNSIYFGAKTLLLGKPREERKEKEKKGKAEGERGCFYSKASDAAYMIASE